MIEEQGTKENCTMDEQPLIVHADVLIQPQQAIFWIYGHALVDSRPPDECKVICMYADTRHEELRISGTFRHKIHRFAALSYTGNSLFPITTVNLGRADLLSKDESAWITVPKGWSLDSDDFKGRGVQPLRLLRTFWWFNHLRVNYNVQLSSYLNKPCVQKNLISNRYLSDVRHRNLRRLSEDKEEVYLACRTHPIYMDYCAFRECCNACHGKPRWKLPFCLVHHFVMDEVQMCLGPNCTSIVAWYI
jgi:hypothetical protein